MSAGVVLPTEVGGELVTATAWLTDHVTAKTAATSAGTNTQRVHGRAERTRATPPHVSRTSPPARLNRPATVNRCTPALARWGNPMPAPTVVPTSPTEKATPARRRASPCRSALYVAAVTAATSTSRRSCQAGDPSSPTTIISPVPTATVAATITRSPRVVLSVGSCRWWEVRTVAVGVASATGEAISPRHGAVIEGSSGFMAGVGPALQLTMLSCRVIVLEAEVPLANAIVAGRLGSSCSTAACPTTPTRRGPLTLVPTLWRGQWS